MCILQFAIAVCSYVICVFTVLNLLEQLLSSTPLGRGRLILLAFIVLLILAQELVYFLVHLILLA